MILKSIKLKNFRQFRDEYVEFAQGDDGKNVTIIIGEIGTGKTSFAQAFFWCMYGETSFSDKSMLNKIIEKQMTPNSVEEVEVDLKLDHGEVEYTLIRKQEYRKNYSDKVKSSNTVFDIQTKNKNGNVSWVKKTQLESEVNGILPKELSRYFFFDGERIEKMSKDISTGKKSADFSEAVQGLLGLNGMKSALDHLNPNRKGCVIGSYENSFDTHSDSKFQEYTNTINRCKENIERINQQLDELNDQLKSATNRKTKKSKEIKLYEEGDKLQREKEKLEKQVKDAERMRSTLYKIICSSFNDNMGSFFSISMIKQALGLLEREEFSGIDIPYMHADTIKFLLNRKICICGTHLDEGTMPYTEVKKLIDVLPPQSISTTVSQFKKDSANRVRNDNDLRSSLKENLATISEQNDNIIDYSDSIESIDKRLGGDDVRAKVRAIQNEIKICDQEINKDKDKIESLIFELGGFNTELDRASSERDRLALRDENNKRIAGNLAYARSIYADIKTEYEKCEEEVRELLQDTINEIFKQIYEGGLSLAIDSKYHIMVYVNDYEGDIETSTAQSISVIFAFITGIIKMARENRNSTDDNMKLLSSEPYPLVMDAPLSAFDKRRIRTVCKALPEISEQVIIFIKDTDGDLAQEHMSDRIGSRHEFKKLNEFETILQ